MSRPREISSMLGLVWFCRVARFSAMNEASRLRSVEKGIFVLLYGSGFNMAEAHVQSACEAISTATILREVLRW